MPTSRFDSIMLNVGIPALLQTFGRAATHTSNDGDEAALTVIFETGLAPVGEYGERMEPRWTAEVAKSAGVQVGDTLAHAGTATDDDPYPDDVVWTTTQVISDDGYTVKFAVRSGT